MSRPEGGAASQRQGPRIPGSAAAVLAIARRELAGHFHAPIAWVVGTLFLAAQGFSFWAVIQSLADPAAAPTYGAVLRQHFGGTLLHWAIVLPVIAAISMRLVAEDKRQGTWELLATAPVAEESLLLGKWLGAVAFYALLWAPTLLHLAVLAAVAGVAVDPGPVLAAYLGVVLVGAGFLAVGIAASAATANQIVAAVLTFALLLGLLLAGQLPELAPGWADGAPRAAAALHAVDVRDHMDRFARGAIDLGPIVIHLGLAAVGLAAAAATATAGRRRPGEVRARALAALLVLVIAALASVLIARHPRRWDVSGGRINSLEPATLAVLAGVREPVEVVVVRPADVDKEPVYREVDRVLEQLQQAQPRITRRAVDPAIDPERYAALAAELDLAESDLDAFGALLVRRGERRRAVDLADVAALEPTAAGAQRLTSFRAEAALAEAIAAVSREDTGVICATGGHGELPVDGRGTRYDWSAVAGRLARDGLRVHDVGMVAGGVPAFCAALVIAGPREPLAADEAMAIHRWLDGGGRLLVAAAAGGPVQADPALEMVLGQRGLHLEREVALEADPDGDPMPTWITRDGYGDHPITARFRGRRATVWNEPRVVRIEERRGVTAVALVGTSERGLVRAADDTLRAQPAAVAAAASAGRSRIVLFGSTEPMITGAGSGDVGAGQALVAAALAWLVGDDPAVAVGDKTPESLAIAMDDDDRRTMFALCVLVIPGLFAVAGWLLWRRRRRA